MPKDPALEFVAEKIAERLGDALQWWAIRYPYEGEIFPYPVPPVKFRFKSGALIQILLDLEVFPEGYENEVVELEVKKLFAQERKIVSEHRQSTWAAEYRP